MKRERQRQKQEGTCDKTDPSKLLCSDLCPPPRPHPHVPTTSQLHLQVGTQPLTHEPVGTFQAETRTGGQREILMTCSVGLTVQL